MGQEVKKGNTKPSNYVLLYYRMQVNAGLKQLFSIQVTNEVATTGSAIPKIGTLD